MILTYLYNALNALTTIPFCEVAWSQAPDADRYGVISMNGQTVLRADENPVAEKMLTGYVDVFTKPTAAVPIDEVESVLKTLGIWFTLQSVQYDENTGFIHYEWTFTDVLNKARDEIARIRFELNEQITEEWLPYGSQPTPPTFTPEYINPSSETNGGCWVVLGGWKPPIVPVNGNVDYKADLQIAVIVTGIKLINPAENSPFVNGYPTTGVKFKQSAYDFMVEALNAGIPVTHHQTNGVLLYTVKSVNGTEAVVVSLDGTERTVLVEVE